MRHGCSCEATDYATPDRLEAIVRRNFCLRRVACGIRKALGPACCCRPSSNPSQNDEFGSRAINPAELYHNQVTREQGPFSLRMFHRSWGLMFIQHNIAAPSTLLDFPTSYSEEVSSRTNRSRG
jgi:hypothetical protein